MVAMIGRPPFPTPRPQEVTVVPPEQRGICEALRAVYREPRAGIPLDLATLLDRLR